MLQIRDGHGRATRVPRIFSPGTAGTAGTGTGIRGTVPAVPRKSVPVPIPGLKSHGNSVPSPIPVSNSRNRLCLLLRSMLIVPEKIIIYHVRNLVVRFTHSLCRISFPSPIKSGAEQCGVIDQHVSFF